MQLEYRILGPLEVLADGGQLSLGGPRQRSVLVELLLRANAVVSRDRLLAAVWGEELPKTAVGTLQVYVHGLRRALGADRIETSGRAYRLRVEPGELDLDRFTRLVEEARDALGGAKPGEADEALATALALWRGMPLADLADQGEAQRAAQTLEERRLEALELRNEARLALGRAGLVLQDVEPLLVEHPYRERLRLQQILALYRSGRQTDALAAYRAAQTAWRDDLGLDLTPALRELERAILRHDESLAAPAPRVAWVGRLPIPPTPLVGRRLEIAAVCSLLRDESRLVTLLGPGGTGKTRLAVAVAHELGAELVDGAVFVDLSSVVDHELVVPAVAQALGVRDETVAGLTASLASRDVLLVLDNLEQVLRAAPQIAALLAAATGVRVLATSRAPLRLSYEHEYPVPPLPLPTATSFEELAANESVRLFAARARAVDPAFVLDGRNAESVAAVCRQVDGLPLAIELAAARVKLFGPVEIAARLEHQPELLAAAPRDVPARHATLTATIEWSYELLGGREQTTFAQLAVFAGGCTVEAAEQVCGADLDVLATLIDNSLLRQRRTGGQPRLLMLETVRRYAVELLETAGAGETRSRHANWLVGLAEEAETEILAGGDPAAWFARLDAEHDNIRAALAWAVDEEPTLALRLAASLRPFWEVRGHLAEGRRWLEDGLARGGADVPDDLRAKATGVTGTFAFHAGDFDLARERFTETLRLFRELGDADGIARELSDLGTVAAAVADLETATDLLQQSADAFRALGNRKRLAIVLANLGHVAGQREDFERAIAMTTEALVIEQELGARQHEAVSLLNLGSYQLRLGDVREARRWYRDCLRLALELEYKEVIAYGLVALVRIALREDDAAQAARLAGVADTLLAETGIGLLASEVEAFARDREAAGARLGEAAYADEHAAGAATAIADALRATGII